MGLSLSLRRRPRESRGRNDLAAAMALESHFLQRLPGYEARSIAHIEVAALVLSDKPAGKLPAKDRGNPMLRSDWYYLHVVGKWLV
jgi:hypothetical protein